MALLVKIGADLNSFDKQMRKMKRSLGYMGDRFKSMGRKMTLGLTAPLLAIGAVGIKTASDLQEVQNVIDTAFGKSANTVDAWAKTTLKQYGLTELQSKSFAGTMRAMVGSMGLADNEADKMAMTLAELSGDLSSFYNIAADDAFAKLRSGISGETEPLKQLGINLSVANLNAFAMSMGMRKSYDAMTEAEKATLRYNYILKNTNMAQGDFNKTSESFANQTRLLKGQLQELSAELAVNLLPGLTKLVTNLNKLTEKFKALDPETKKIITGVLAVVAALGPLLLIIGSVINSVAGLSVIAGALGVSLGVLGAIIVAVIVGIAAQIYVMIDLYNRFKELDWAAAGKGIEVLWDKFKGINKAMVNEIIGYVNTVINAIVKGINFAASKINGLIKGMNKAPGINIPLIPEMSDGTLNIPMLAKGGIATGPTLAMIGEAGKEAVIPLSKLDSMTGGGNYTVIFEMDGREVARKTAPHIPGVLRLQSGLRL